MRIGEIAAVVGVTTRTIRHYHQLGLLPEPERRANGYRDYGLRHAVVLARIRRLTELGLGLAEVRDVLADDAGRDLAEVLAELDDDLARQEAAIKDRRARLRALLSEAERGRLPAEGPVSPGLAALFGDMAHASAQLPGPEPAMAAKDREILALIETTAAPEDGERLLATLRDAALKPGAMERAYELYALLDALAEAEPSDPRVDDAAQALADLIPDAFVAEVGTAQLAAVADASVGSSGGGRGTSEASPHDTFLSAFFADFAPAQAEAVRRAMRMLAQRGAQ
ncbi:MerR family transcriptional regulator [Streptomyces jeddahensis]|uniref:Mercuric resistance operon regulatory protein n=1 Tax=Streptomyces jeddahensis TaxID=1716141 RepID=A0A177HLW9_9ACTN|nr:MerR family transcriptional regulator [Streptomyces jeddahensis]OAH11244.1 mercuric resistance operon regulatory protein [Streptomyces jeddahensis]